MRYLVDTNILLRSVEENHSMNGAAVNAVQFLLIQGEELFIMSQNLIEFWAVATRPSSANGLELSLVEASTELAELKSIFTLQPDIPEIFPIWEQLVMQHQVVGKQTHDTRLVAAMIVYKITHLLTFNTEDFTRFTEITVIDPREISIQRTV
jgi:predicted nucleic acid-binding protein